MLRFFISRTFFINLLIAIMLICGLVWFSLRYLSDYTLHGQTITVPDLTGQTVEEVEATLSERSLRFKVRDVIYDVNRAKGVVLDQDPKPESSVKENRTIYLVVNASETPKVAMPDLVDKTLRRAISILEIRGFKLGELEFVPDIGNKVSSFKYNGQEIEAGFKVPKGATIDLILAAGESTEKIKAPNTIGLRLDEAIMALKESSLNVAPARWDKETVITVSDTLNARVHKQDPRHGDKLINLGGYVQLWLTMDYDMILVDSVAEPDSTNMPQSK